MEVPLKRFQKLAKGFVVAILWLILICFAAGAVYADAPKITIRDPQLKKLTLCLADLDVDISYPSNETWWYDSQLVHVPVLRHPIAVAYAKSTSQVQELVKCATKSQIKMNPRSGSHSNAALSNEDNYFVIDVSGIDHLRISDDNQTATIGPGMRLGRLYYELGKHGMVFPAGQCPTVGMGGHVGAGGIGLLMRLWGITADNVLELEMVDYRGKVLVANEKTNQELFFALRGGGGGSYGIVTEIKLKIYPNPPLSTAFTVHWNKPIKVSDLSKAWFKWKPWNNMPHEMSFHLYVSTVTVMMGIYIGEDGNVGVERILNESGLLEVGDKESQNYEYYSSNDLTEARAWMDSNNVHNGNDWDYHAYNTPSSFILKPLHLPPYPIQVHPTWAQIQNDSRVNATHLIGSDGAIGPILEQEPLLINRNYTLNSNQFFVKEFDEAAYKVLEEYLSHDETIILFIPYGGVLYDMPEGFNAFPHRRQLFLLEYYTPYYPAGTHEPSGVSGQKNMSETLITALEPYTNHMSYQGNADLFFSTDPKKYMPRYYGDHVQRLIHAKVKYDPKDFFSNQQSTPLAL